MSWLESHQELRDHPKTARLRRRLGVSLPTAIGHLHLLWWWALDYAPSGDLSSFDPDVLADAACWEDDPGLFVRALLAAGFVDEDLKIHDWDDYAGRLLDRREANARRMRAARWARRAAIVGDAPFSAREPDNTAARAAHVRGLPDLTGPDLTGPDRTTSPQPPPLAEGARPRRRRRHAGDAVETPPQPLEVPADLAPATPADVELWDTARAELTDGWLPANAAKAAACVPLGRDTAGALWLSAPPWASTVVSSRQAAVALSHAGDDAGAHVVIVEV